ncbi:transposase family protein [Streptomyces sp. NPDC007205]|uniref:transposase family protein n=1 Tax=Streptomyces sp. NPDC007205 TaxID=3154316 RepID=UPI00340236BA
MLSCAVALAGDGAVEGVDPRDRRGRRYPLVALVRAAACAVAAGACAYAAIGHWLRRAPQDALARLGFPVRGALGVRPAASMDTVRRVIEHVHPDGLAALLRPAGEEQGRPLRLAADGGDGQAHPRDRLRHHRPARTPGETRGHACAATGTSRTKSTTCATPSGTKTAPRSAPATAPRTWPPCATPP